MKYKDEPMEIDLNAPGSLFSCYYMKSIISCQSSNQDEDREDPRLTKELQLDSLL